jgi:hypothetical protein
MFNPAPAINGSLYLVAAAGVNCATISVPVPAAASSYTVIVGPPDAEETKMPSRRHWPLKMFPLELTCAGTELLIMLDDIVISG